MDSTFSIGLDKASYKQVMNALSMMEKIDQRPAIQKALKDGAKEIIAQGKTNLAARNKARKGNLKRSFTSRLYKRTKGIYAGFRRPKGAAAHLVDRGTVERWTKKGQYRGRIVGTLFWTDAVESRGDEALNTIVDSIINELKNIIQ